MQYCKHCYQSDIEVNDFKFELKTIFGIIEIVLPVCKRCHSLIDNCLFQYDNLYESIEEQMRRHAMHFRNKALRDMK